MASRPQPLPEQFLWSGSRHSPQRVSHPSKDSPRPQPHRVSTAVALLTLPPLLLSEEKIKVRAHTPASRALLPKKSRSHCLLAHSLPAVASPPSLPVAGARLQRASTDAAAFKALLRRRVRTAAGSLPTRSTAYPSMGFVPLQGSIPSASVPSRGETRDPFVSLAPRVLFDTASCASKAPPKSPPRFT
jgi:hypothetical protein